MDTELEGVIFMLRKLVATTTVAVLLVTACSDDNDGATSTEPAATGEASTTDAAKTTEPSATTEVVDTTEPSETSPTATTADESAALDASAQYESLAARPWASPDDAHETPEAAVAAFLEFATSDAAGGLFAVDDVAVGEYLSGDARSGEVPVEFVGTFFDETASAQVPVVMTVIVRQAGPQDTWWVVAAATDGLTVAAPTADAVVEPAFDLDMTNDLIVDAVQVRLFAAGDDEAFYVANVNGGGIFATGQRAATLDTTLCGDVDVPESPAIDFLVEVCDGPGAAGAEGVLVATSSAGITTVPVVFGE